MTWDERGDEFLKGLSAPDDEALKYLSLWVRGRRMALPPDEPSYRLLHRLAVAHQKMERLGELGALLLQKWIDGQWKVVNFEEAAYNLLHLATELRDGRQLGRLIWMLYQRRIVQGDYLGTELTEPLLEAMIANQTSGDEVELWDRLLMGTVDEYVGGSVEQGFRGAAQHQPPGPHLVTALVQIYQRIDSRLTVDGLLAYLHAVHPGTDLDGLLGQVKMQLAQDVLAELTRRRNQTADMLIVRGYRPDDQAEWNMRWRQVIKDAIDDLKLREPLLKVESEEIITYHLHQQFRGVNRQVPLQHIAYQLLYSSCQNVRPTSVRVLY